MAVIEAIATTYLEAGVVSVTFSSIPQTYEHLQLRMSGRTNYGSRSGWTTLNGDTGGNYSAHRMGGSGSSVAAAGWGTLSYIIGPYLTGTNASATEYSPSIVDILDYANTNKNTTLMYATYTQGGPDVFFGSALWDSTAAVTSITYTEGAGGSHVITRGSVFTLYGLNSS